MPCRTSPWARCLHEMGYSLQANVKTVAGTQHEDRDQQFRYINKQVSRFLRARGPGRQRGHEEERIGRIL